MSRPVSKKDSLEAAALELFARQGIEGTTTKQIAARAGAAEGTMFRHWATKEDLAWDLYDRHLRRFVSDLDAVVAAAVGTRSRLRALIERCYALYESSPTLGSYLLLAEHSATRRMPPGYRTPVDALVDLIREGQEKRDLKPGEPALLAALVFGAVLRVALFKIRGRLAGDLRGKVDEVADAVFSMLRA